MQLTNLATLQAILWNILKMYHQPPDEVFTQAGLDPAVIFKPGKRYPIKKTVKLWKEAAKKISDPCFALHVADCWHPSHLGTLGYAMLASTNIRSALKCLIRFHKVVSDIPFGTLHEDLRKQALVLTLTDREDDIYLPQLEDAVLTLVLSILRMNYQKPLNPIEVNLKHAPPDCSYRYYEFFKSPVQFNAAESNMALPLSVVDVRLTGANQEIAELNEHLMNRYLVKLGYESIIDRVKRVIIEHLPSGDATVENAAKRLGMSIRTLQRQLQMEGSSFVNLLHETRRELARQYIKNTEMELTEIAFLLGFSELSTFSRSFKKWTGKSPALYRRSG